MKLPRRHILSWSRLMVFAWTSLWLLAAPLFHVHPDVDHHGEAGHTHNGTIHAVWSPDLDCEFDSHEDHADTVSGPVEFAHSGFSHLEIGLSLLNDSSDRKFLKPFFTQALGCLSATGSDTEYVLLFHRAISSIPSDFPPVGAKSSRAPPSFLL